MHENRSLGVSVSSWQTEIAVGPRQPVYNPWRLANGVGYVLSGSITFGSVRGRSLTVLVVRCMSRGVKVDGRIVSVSNDRYIARRACMIWCYLYVLACAGCTTKTSQRIEHVSDLV
jgi:hypothetical protein